jgi:hypothetical protein
MDVHIVMSTAEVIITSIAGPTGVIIYFLCRFFLMKKSKN